MIFILFGGSLGLLHVCDCSVCVYVCVEGEGVSLERIMCLNFVGKLT